MPADMSVALEVRPQGFVKGAREASAAAKELTASTKAEGQAARETSVAEERLAEAERRRISASAEMIRNYKQKITALAEYRRALLEAGTAEAARARLQVAATGTDPNSKLGASMTALIAKERELRQSIQETAAEAARANQVTANVGALQARTRALQDAVAAARLGADAERAYAAAVEIARQVAASGARPGTDQAAAVEREVIAQKKLEEELHAVAAARQRDASAAREAAAAQERVSGEISRLRETTSQLEILAAAHRRGGAAVQAANVQLEVRNALLRAGVSAGTADAAAIEQQVRAQAKLREQIDQSSAATRRQGDSTLSLRNAFFALQAVLATLGLARLISESLEVVSTFNRIDRVLGIVTGSSGAAAQQMAFIRAEANRLGLEIQTLGDGYSRFLAAAKGSLTLSEARDVFVSVTEAMANLGASTTATNLSLLALQQMASKGTVSSEELRRQLGEHLPGAMKLAAEALGKTIPEFTKLLESGQILSKDLLPKLAVKIRETFGTGGAEVQTLTARMNRVKNAVTDLKASFGAGLLEGFLGGFADITGALTDAKIQAAARDFGETVGKSLKLLTDGAIFLAENLEKLKAVLLAIFAIQLAPKIAALGVAMKAAALAAGEASAATWLWNAALAALPLVAVALALSAVVVAMQGYISAQNLAHRTELERLAKSQEFYDYYSTLRANKIGLTQEELAYANQVRITMETERAALAVSLARTRAQYEASKTLNPFKYHAVAGPGRNALREQVGDQERELQILDNQLNALHQQWDRLGKLPVIKLPVDAEAVSKAAKKVGELLDGFRRTAEQAEQVARAQRTGADEAKAVTDAIERQNAAYQALHSIEGLSAAAKARLTGIIEQYVGRTQEATRATEAFVATRQKDLEYSTAARTAEAQLADLRAGTTEASRELTAQLEAEATARDRNRAEDGAFIAAEKAANVVRNDYLRSLQAETVAATRKRDWLQELSGLTAELGDAQTESNLATQAHAIALEAERLQIDAGVASWEDRGKQLRQEVEERALIRQHLKGQIEQQLRLNEAQSRQREAKAGFDDMKEQAEAARRYGTEIAGILRQYGLLNTATRQLALAERARAIAISEGADLQSNKGFLRLLQIQAELQGYEDLIDAQAREAANYEIAQTKAANFYSSLASTFATLSQTLGGASTSTGRLVGSLGNLVTALGALKTAGKAWSDQWAQAMAGAIAGVGQLLASLKVGGSAKTGGAQALGGRLDSNYAGIGSLVGAIIGAAIAAYFSGGSATAGGAALGGAIGTVIGSLISKAGDSASAQLLQDGSILVGETSQQLNGAIKDALMNIFKGLNAELAALGLQLAYLPPIDIKVRDNIVRVIVGGIVRTFSSMNDAISFGIAEALRQAGTSGGHLPPEVIAALRNSTATDLEALKADLAFAQSIANYGVPQVVQAIDKSISEFYVAMQRATQLGIDTSKVVAKFADDLRAQKDAILGIDRTKSPQDRLRADVAAFNQRMLLMDAERKADLAALLAKKADLQVRIAILEADLNVTKLNLAALNTMKGALAALDIAIATTQGLINSIVTISDKELADALARLGKGGGRSGGGTDTRKALADTLQEAEWQRYLRTLSEYKASVAEINKKWNEQIPLAKGNADLLDRIAKARADEIAVLREQGKKDLQEQLRPFTTDAGKSDWTIRLEELQRNFEDARKKAKELGEALWKVTAAEKRAAEALGRELVGSFGLASDQTRAQMKTLADSLAFLRTNAATLGITAAEVARITAELGNQLYVSLVDSLLKYVTNEDAKRALEELRYQMEIANIKLQFELVKAMNVLTAEQVAQVEALIAALPAHVPVPAGAPGSPGGGGGGGGSDSGTYAERVQQDRDRYRQSQGLPTAAEQAQRIAEAMERLRGYESLGLSPMAAEIARVNADFEQLRAVLGNTTRVQQAYNLAIQDVMNRFLQPIRELQQSLSLSQYSPLRAMDRLREAQEQFQASLTALQHGDLSQLEVIASYAQTYLQEALAALPQGSAAYGQIYSSVQAALAAILQQYGGQGTTTQPGAPGPNVPGAPATPTQTPPTIPPVNIQPVVTQLQTSAADELVELREIKRNTGNTATNVYALIRRFDQPITVFERVS